jgi:hypothetical protein
MTPGIHTIPMSAYLADPCPEPSLSSSLGNTLLTRSARHAWCDHPKLGGRVQPESERANIGTAAHDMLLGGEGAIQPLNFPDWRTNASKDARAAARAAGKTPVLASAMPEIELMVHMAKEFIAGSEIAGVFERGRPEQTLIWHESEAGIWCRARPDWLTDDHKICLHYKSTTSTARPETFLRGPMRTYGYAFALRFYARGLTAVSSLDQARHLILAQEQEPPHSCSLIGLSPALTAIEDRRVQEAIAIWGKCVTENKWPSYDGRVHWAEPFPWELAEVEGMEGLK